MKPECQAKNLKGLTMVAVGVNKSAEQYLLLDEDTKAELARASITTSGAAPSASPAGPGRQAASPAAPTPGQPRPARRPARRGQHRHGQHGQDQPGEGTRRSPATPRGPRLPGTRVTAPAGGPVQPAGPAAGRDRPQARAEPVRRHADHPGGAEPREELRPGPDRGARGAAAGADRARAGTRARPAARGQPPSANSARTPSSRTGRRSVNRSSAASAASRMASASAVGPGSDRE